MGANLGTARDNNFFERKIDAKEWPCRDALSYAAVFQVCALLHVFRRSSRQLQSATWPAAAPVTELIRAQTTVGRDKDGKLWLGCSLRSCRDGLLPSRRATPLNLAVCLDVSGSMQNGFTDPKTEEELLAMVSKIDRCRDFVDQLRAMLRAGEDRISVSFFSERSGTVPEEQLGNLREALPVGGGTRLVLGLREAAAQARAMRAAGSEGAETRVVFLTDMCDTSEDAGGPQELLQLSAELSREGIHVTYIGVGVDFDGETTRLIARVPGCNWFCCASQHDLERILADLNSAFCPVAASVELNLVAPSHRILRVVGSDHGGRLESAAPWTPATHALYPREARRALAALVGAALIGMGIWLPKEVVGEIARHAWPCHRFVAQEFAVFPSRTVDSGGFVLFQLESDVPEAEEGPVQVNLRCNGVRVQSEVLPAPRSLPLGCPDAAMRLALTLTAFCDQCRAALPEAPGATLPPGQRIAPEFVEWFREEAKELPLERHLQTLRALQQGEPPAAGVCAIQ